MLCESTHKTQFFHKCVVGRAADKIATYRSVETGLAYSEYRDYLKSVFEINRKIRDKRQLCLPSLVKVMALTRNCSRRSRSKWSITPSVFKSNLGRYSSERTCTASTSISAAPAIRRHSSRQLDCSRRVGNRRNERFLRSISAASGRNQEFC